MKRLFLIVLAIFAISTSQIWAGGENVTLSSELEASYGHGDRLYSNSYDGYTNVRSAPSSKGQVLGRLYNGSDYVICITLVDNWFKVNFNGRVGYVHKNYVSDTPSEPVTSGVDANWLNGYWSYDGSMAYVIFSNGRFAQEHQYGTLAYGKWRLEGDKIVLRVSYVTSYGRDFEIKSGQFEEFTIDKQNRTVGYMNKWQMPDELEEGEDGITKSYFAILRKEANTYAK